MGETCIAPEHLFLGLMNEPPASLVRCYSISESHQPNCRKEVFKVRLAQMRIVERIVRPLRASTPRKRKMREELLAHLSAIYDQELVRLHNPAAALEAAAAAIWQSRAK